MYILLHQLITYFLYKVHLFKRSKRSATAVAGRADGGAKVILENCEVDGCGEVRELRPGDYVAVEVHLLR